MRTTIPGFIAAALPLVLVLSGCGAIEETGPLEKMSKSFDFDKSEMLRAEFKMGVGELRVSGGSKKMAETEFEWNVPSWKPVVEYNSTGFRGHLRIEQQKSSKGSVGGGQKNTWNVKVNDTVPVDFDFRFGVGEAKLDLREVNIRSLELHMGVGEVDLDLRGTPKKDYRVEIRGGVGEATIRLPKNVGIVADAKGGIGGIHTTGLKQEGGRYVNDAYKNNPAVTIRLDVKGGVGAINLYAE